MFSHVKMKKKPVFMIIPMIDIIFFLLVFFMMNSLQTVAQHEQEKMYVVDLDASELTDSGSGHAGGCRSPVIGPDAAGTGSPDPVALGRCR